MPAYRFFIPDLNQEPLLLTGEEFKHLKNVMRMHVGDTVELTDGKGTLAQATISSIEKKQATLSITNRSTITKRQATTTLYLAHIRPNKIDLVIEMVSALGVDRIVLFPAEKSEKKTPFSSTQIQRHLLMAISACKQSGRLLLPELIYIDHLDQIEEECLFFCDPKSTTPFWNALEKTLPLSSIGIVIGPESGFTEKEEAFLQKKGEGVSLGNLVYRAELAAIAASSIVEHYLAPTSV